MIDTFPLPQVQTLVSDAPAYPFWGRLLHKHQLPPYKSILEAAGYPMLYPGHEEKPVGDPSVIRALIFDDHGKQLDFIPFSRRYQLFSYSLIWNHSLKIRPSWTPAERERRCKKAFAQLYRGDCFQTNKAGTDTCRDYVNDANEGKQDPKLYPVFTAGNIVRVQGEPRRMFGNDYYPVWVMNSYAGAPNPDNVNWDKKPQVIHMATIETRIWNGDNKRVIRPFDFQDISGMPVFVLSAGNTIAWIDVTRVQRISAAEAMANNPYA